MAGKHGLIPRHMWRWYLVTFLQGYQAYFKAAKPQQIREKLTAIGPILAIEDARLSQDQIYRLMDPRARVRLLRIRAEICHRQ